MNNFKKVTPNYYQVETDSAVIAVSYNVVIARIACGHVELDARYYNYSNTTSKHLRHFLGHNMAETRKRIKTGQYTLANLNE